MTHSYRYYKNWKQYQMQWKNKRRVQQKNISYDLFDVEIPAQVYQVCMNFYVIQFILYNVLYQQN